MLRSVRPSTGRQKNGNGERYDWQDHRYPRSGCGVGVCECCFGAVTVYAPYAKSYYNQDGQFFAQARDEPRSSSRGLRSDVELAGGKWLPAQVATSDNPPEAAPANTKYVKELNR
jgi:hypothetical protein